MHHGPIHHRRFSLVLVALLGICLLRSSSVQAQGLEQVKASYSKAEYYPSMRDGTRLYTAVYTPKDQSKTYPIMLLRTPYGSKPYGSDQYRSDLGPSPLFGTSGYIFVYQDVRGRGESEGDFVNVRPIEHLSAPNAADDSTDTWDTIDWLIKSIPGHNGKVGMSGVSYPGYYVNAALIDSHPALVAASPQAPVVDWFIGDDFHHNGALVLTHTLRFFNSIGISRSEAAARKDWKFDMNTSDEYDFLLRQGPLPEIAKVFRKQGIAYWEELMEHDTYDFYWKSRNILQHFKDVRPAVLTVGGWFDAEDLFGALATFQQIEKVSPRTQNSLVMGPWSHGSWSRNSGESLGQVSFQSKTGAYYREQIEFPFFEYHLKGIQPHEPTKAWIFETGSNQWRKFDRWPPDNSVEKSFYLNAEGRLSSNIPPADLDGSQVDEYLSDPNKPVPFMERTTAGMPSDYMTADQRFATRRPDVVCYQTDVLETELKMHGPIEVDLTVSTTGTDSDWVVKLIDIYPDGKPYPVSDPEGKLAGYHQLVRGDLFRGKFRHSFEKPEPATPSKPEQIRFTMPDVCHSFLPGHRVMVQVQSSWFPLFDRNPQTFVKTSAATRADFQKATQRVYRSMQQPSQIRFRAESP